MYLMDLMNIATSFSPTIFLKCCISNKFVNPPVSKCNKYELDRSNIKFYLNYIDCKYYY